MRTIPFALIAYLCLAYTATYAASSGPRDFRTCADVQEIVRPNALYTLHLSQDVLERCSAGCPDLRLFGPDGREVPFTIIQDISPAEPQEKYRMEITGYSDGPEAEIFMQLPERHRPVSLIEVHTPDRDFKKQVVLSSSKDGRVWRTIKEDAIYDFSSHVDLRKTKIEFRKTSDRYFRLKLLDYEKTPPTDKRLRLRYEGLDFSVEGMAQKELNIREIYGLTGVYRESVPSYDSRTVTGLSPKTDKDGNTVMVIKAGLPLDRMSFYIANLYYSRQVSVYAGDEDRDDALRFIARGTIYSFALDGRKEEQGLLEVHSPKAGYYRIVIENRGNPPLDVRSVTLSWTRQNLYFIPVASSGRYTLCFGNEDIPGPEYDIARFITRESLSRHSPTQAGLGPLRENPDFVSKRPRRVREQIEKIALVSIVIILVIGMGYWAYSLIRKASPKKP